MNFFTQMLSEGGKISSTRFVFVLWGVGVLSMYCYGVIAGRPEPLPQSLDVLGMTALLGGFKVMQKGTESKTEIETAKAANGKPEAPVQP